MGKKFDIKGLFFVIREIGKGYKLPLPEYLEDHGFCLFCLGANVPNQSEYHPISWCCGAFADDLLPPLKICKRFQANKEKIKEFAKSIRPDGTEMMSVFEHA